MLPVLFFTGVALVAALTAIVVFGRRPPHAIGLAVLGTLVGAALGAGLGALVDVVSAGGRALVVVGALAAPLCALVAAMLAPRRDGAVDRRPAP